MILTSDRAQTVTADGRTYHLVPDEPVEIPEGPQALRLGELAGLTVTAPKAKPEPKAKAEAKPERAKPEQETAPPSEE